MSTLPSQLRMGFSGFGDLAAPEPIAGYGLRSFRPGDEDAWLTLLASGDFGTWDRARLERLLAGERATVLLAGIFFATQADQPVGTACALIHPGEQGQVAELGWVVVDPLHRGHGLGLQVCRAVLRFIRELGHGYAFLLTDDFRRPAIETYLRLGFEPELVDPSHPARWEALLRPER